MKRIATLTAALVGVALALSLIASTTARGPAQPARSPLVAAVHGRVHVDGRDLIVEILVAVPDGADADAAAHAALHRAYPEALPLTDGAQATGYTTNGLVWTDPPPPVVVNYNAAGSPLAGAKTDLLAAMTSWSTVATSSFSYVYGADTTRCPSLVKECPGGQTLDGNHDVGWADIADSSVLGVTWYSTSADEFDIILDNANFVWAAACTGNYSLQTVYLHELGHAVGLGHSEVTTAVMYAYYSGPRCALAQPDIDGVSALYPAAGGGAPTPTPALSASPTPVPTATPANCPPGKARRGRC